MRSLSLGCTVFCVALAIVCSGLQAEAGEKKGQLYMVAEYTVKASKTQEFENIMKEWIAEMKKQKFPLHFQTLQDLKFHYLFVWPMKDHGDWDHIHDVFGAFAKKMGKKYQDLELREQAAFSSVRRFTIRRIPELSYQPAKPRLKPSERRVAVWDMLYFQPGNHGHAIGLMKKLTELARKKKIDLVMDAHAAEIGLSFPLYIMSMYGKGTADIWATNSAMWKKLGKEGGELAEEFFGNLRKRDVKTFFLRPDLSY